MRDQKTLLLVEAKAPAEGDGPGSFEGYASMFGTEPDSYADVIDPGAYKDTIAPFLADGFIAWSHDWSNPIATPTTLREDERGLFLSATFHTHDEAQRAREEYDPDESSNPPYSRPKRQTFTCSNIV